MLVPDERRSRSLVTREPGVAELSEPEMAYITVCICTFRRPSLLRTIDSITTQSVNGALAAILVIDNDDSPSAREAIESREPNAQVDIKYLHAPARNISVARNAALDAVTTPWLAFIDDDEYASSDWLHRLSLERHGAHAIFGLSKAIYSSSAPQWIIEGDYHSNYVLNRVPINTGYTSNALIDVEFVRKNALRFDPQLGTTGGEDTIFFHHMFRAGGVLKYSPHAVAYEEVIPSRLNFWWVAKRRFRVGQVYAMMFHRFNLVDYRTVVWSAPVKVSSCVAMAAVMIWRPNRAIWWLMRSIFHAGSLSFALGIKLYEEYRTASRN
jgi:succinoglycan biosynthesis protein ExoM